MKKALFLVGILATAIFIGYAYGVRQAYWITSSNLVDLLVLRATSSEKTLALVDGAIDANLVWIQEKRWPMLPSEEQEIRRALASIYQMWLKKTSLRPLSEEDPSFADWKTMRDKNLAFLKQQSEVLRSEDDKK